VPVSTSSSRVVYDALKATGVRLISALPETWLVHLIRMAEDDPEMTLVRLAKEEEGVGISTGAHLAGVKSAMLMQNHGFLASIRRAWPDASRTRRRSRIPRSSPSLCCSRAS
jgi:sulfopyruvate decarboxylase subunit alpha